MERMIRILYSLGLSSLLILSSCGKDVSTNKKIVNTSPLYGEECELNSIHMPVCGIDSNGKETNYQNISYAKCFKATNIAQGECTNPN